MIRLLFTAAALLLAAPDRHRIVAGWQVEDRAGQDGGRLVEMRRESGGYRLQFHAAFQRGNGVPFQGTMVEFSDCTNGDELPGEVRATVAEIRARLARHMRDCGASRSRIAAALRGIERAYRLASAWADEAATAAAEARD